jgi:hypothetical protein
MHITASFSADSVEPITRLQAYRWHSMRLATALGFRAVALPERVGELSTYV